MTSLEKLPEDYILTPHGFRHVSFCEEVCPDGRCEPVRKPLGTSTAGWMRALDRDLFQQRARGPAGWLEAATFTPSVPLRSMSVKFQVPEPPARPDSLIYLFPGFEGPWMTNILQPVLQWGPDLKDHLWGEQFWSISAWYCAPDGRSRVSCDRPCVEPGETLVASMNMVGLHEDCCDWMVEIKVPNDSKKCARLDVPGVKGLFLLGVAGALEAYSLDPLEWNWKDDRLIIPRAHDWQQYPSGGSTTFYDIEVKGLDDDDRYLKLNWNAKTLSRDSGLEVTVAEDRRSVTLIY